MRVTVLWEDQRAAARTTFAPHELLLACISDDLGLARDPLKNLVHSIPRKGNGSLRKALQRELRRFRRFGPVVAVVDRDQLHGLWPPKPPPPTCIRGLSERFRQDAPGDYELVLLDRNMESLVEVACRALRKDLPRRKPGPDQRDQLLMPAVWEAEPVRRAIRDGCPSFARVVLRVAEHLRPRSPSA